MWCSPLIPVLGSRGRLFSVLETSLVYKINSRATKITQRNLVFRNRQTNENHNKTKTAIIKKKVGEKRKCIS